MRKKQLLAQNMSLFEQLEKSRGQEAIKDKKIKELEDRIKALNARLEQAQPQPQPEFKPQTQSQPQTVTEPFRRLEERVANNKKLQPDFEYASEVIGKLVFESANGSNILTSGGNTKYRELVNLLLGKTEVAKAEILAVVTGGDTLDAKVEKIDKIRDETLDYFQSVLAQTDAG